MRSLFRRAPRLLERDTLALRLDDGREVEIARVRDPRARRLRLLVSERGVRLTVPRTASLREADAFLDAHRDWLGGQVARFAVAPDRSPGLVIGETAALPLRGAPVPVEWREGRYARIARDEAAIDIHVPSRNADAALRRALRDFYLAEARADLGRWLPKFLPTLPRPPRTLRLRPLSSLWGSLSSSDALSLDLALVLARPSAFEYVLVHELCHLIHANHSRAFWHEVEARFPDWRDERGYLRGDGLRIKRELAGLLG